MSSSPPPMSDLSEEEDDLEDVVDDLDDDLTGLSGKLNSIPYDALTSKPKELQIPNPDLHSSLEQKQQDPGVVKKPNCPSEDIPEAAKDVVGLVTENSPKEQNFKDVNEVGSASKAFEKEKVINEDKPEAECDNLNDLGRLESLNEVFRHNDISGIDTSDHSEGLKTISKLPIDPISIPNEPNVDLERSSCNFEAFEYTPETRNDNCISDSSKFEDSKDIFEAQNINSDDISDSKATNQSKDSNDAFNVLDVSKDFGDVEQVGDPSSVAFETPNPFGTDGGDGEDWADFSDVNAVKDEDEDFGDFAEMKSASISETLASTLEQLEGKLAETFEKLFGVLEKEKAMNESLNILNLDQDCIWNDLHSSQEDDVSSTQVQFSWDKAESRLKLLKVLKIDPKNVVFDFPNRKRIGNSFNNSSNNLPSFASNLNSFNLLQPTKIHEESGLSSPIEPITEQKSNKTKTITTSEKLFKKLPNLNFMQSKVLSIPDDEIK